MNKEYGTARIKIEYVILAVLVVFFGGLFLLTGAQEFPDTDTYIHMHTDREPLYPLFLLLFRSIFKQYALTATAAAQNILAIAACYLLICCITKIFRLKWLGCACVTGLVLVPHILTPLSSASNMVLTNSILSEGITYSLFYLFVYFLSEAVLGEHFHSKALLGGLLTALLNSLARGQMMAMLLAWGVAACYICLRSGKWKKITLVILGVALAFGVRSVSVKTYNYVVNGQFVGNSGAGTTFLTNILYSATQEDAADIENPEEKQLFEDIFLRAQDDELNYIYAPEGFLEQALYHEDTHDKLKFEHVEKYVTWYVSDRMEESGVFRETEIDRTALELGKKILPHSFKRWLYVYFCVALSGFVRTVAVIHPLLNLYAVFLYGAGAVLTVWSLLKRGMTKAVRCVLLAVLLVCANVFATSVTIMCLSRYMIYNMPVVYIAGFLLLREIWQEKKRK